MSSRFGYDFSQVRVHSDVEAASSARTLRARAYAVGHDIVFGPGQYAPATGEGNRLLAHELTHVLQHAGEAPFVLSRKPGDKEEEKERTRLLTVFSDGAGLPDKTVGKISAAMNAFSLHQLHAMEKAGLRFWPGDSLPSEFKDRVKVDPISTPAEYVDVIHIIRMADNATTDAIRHEMAHAWDHVRTGKVKPVAQLKGKEFEQALQNTPELSSTTSEKRPTKELTGGKMKSARMPISEMLKRYRRFKLREESFDNPSTRESYSKRSVREFYAEGYSVFHGGREWNQARLLYYAPELYEMLETEAKEEGLDVPDRSKVEAAMKDQNLQP